MNPNIAIINGVAFDCAKGDGDYRFTIYTSSDADRSFVKGVMDEIKLSQKVFGVIVKSDDGWIIEGDLHPEVVNWILGTLEFKITNPIHHIS